VQKSSLVDPDGDDFGIRVGKEKVQYRFGHGTASGFLPNLDLSEFGMLERGARAGVNYEKLWF
jgi:hypothetical protein